MSFQELGKLTENRATTLAFSEEEINSILRQFADKDSFLKVDTNLDLKRRLEFLLKRQTNFRLHATTLAEYLKVKRIPRGLRILLKPTLCKDNEDFLARWRMILNKCSLDLIALTIQELQKDLIDIEKEVDTTKVTLERAINGEDWHNIAKELELSINHHREEIERVKIRKFRRDTQDYKSNCVYTWYEGLEQGSRRHFYNRQVGASASSSEPGSQSEEEQEGRGVLTQPTTSGITGEALHRALVTSTGQTAPLPFLARGPRGGKPGGGGRAKGTYPLTRSQKNP